MRAKRSNTAKLASAVDGQALGDTEGADLPPGWRLTAFGSLINDSQNGCGARSGHGEPAVVLRLADVSVDGQVARKGLRSVGLTAAERAKYALRRGDLLAFRVNGSASIAGRVVAYSGPEGYAYCDHFIRFRVDEAAIDPRFAALAFNEPTTRAEVEARMVSSAGQNTVSQASFREIPMRLPPLAQQRRIVQRVEVLQARLAGAREHLIRTRVILKRFRQSVLAAACSGRLTEDWRRNRSSSVCRPTDPVDIASPFDGDAALPEVWPRLRLGDLLRVVTSGSRGWSRYYDDVGRDTFVMAQNVRPMKLEVTPRFGLNLPAVDPEKDRTRVCRDDVLVTIVGANTADVCRVPFDVKDHYVCQSVALLRPIRAAMAPYLELWLNSPAHGRRDLLDLAYGEGRPHLGLDDIRDLEIAVPADNEQAELLRRVGRLLATTSAIDGLVAQTQMRAAQLSYAVLAEALCRSAHLTARAAGSELVSTPRGLGQPAHRESASPPGEPRLV